MRESVSRGAALVLRCEGREWVVVVVKRAGVVVRCEV